MEYYAYKSASKNEAFLLAFDEKRLSNVACMKFRSQAALREFQAKNGIKTANDEFLELPKGAASATLRVIDAEMIEKNRTMDNTDKETARRVLPLDYKGDHVWIKE